MQQELQSLLYIGAFIDCTPLSDDKFDNIDRFIYVDGAPGSGYWYGKCLGHYEAQNFEECLKISIESSGRVIKSFEKPEENTYHVKFEDGKEMYYFYNTSFPNNITNSMIDIIQKCQYIMCTGMLVTDEIREYLEKECLNIHTQYIGYVDDDQLYNLENVGYINYDSMEKEYNPKIDFPDFDKTSFKLLKTSNYTMQTIKV
jgi:hypothetical protein